MGLKFSNIWLFQKSQKCKADSLKVRKSFKTFKKYQSSESKLPQQCRCFPTFSFPFYLPLYFRIHLPSLSTPQTSSTMESPSKSELVKSIIPASLLNIGAIASKWLNRWVSMRFQPTPFGTCISLDLIILISTPRK